MINLGATLALLSEQRPIFHSEADFQHALAWLIHLRYPDAQLRLEYRLFREEPLYLDLWILNDECTLAIELKYPTRQLSAQHTDEQFCLKNHSAQDVIRYDFIKDISRLERSVLKIPGVIGYAILLTNDSAYWTPSPHPDTTDAALRLHEGANLSGSLEWAPHAGAGTMKGRESALELRGSYQLSWSEYSPLDGHPKKQLS
jgi:hypothetical protein